MHTQQFPRKHNIPSVQCVTPGSSQASGLLKPEGILESTLPTTFFTIRNCLTSSHISSFNRHQYTHPHSITSWHFMMKHPLKTQKLKQFCNFTSQLVSLKWRPTVPKSKIALSSSVKSTVSCVSIPSHNSNKPSRTPAKAGLNVPNVQQLGSDPSVLEVAKKIQGYTLKVRLVRNWPLSGLNMGN